MFLSRHVFLICLCIILNQDDTQCHVTKVQDGQVKLNRISIKHVYEQCGNHVRWDMVNTITDLAGVVVSDDAGIDSDGRRHRTSTITKAFRERGAASIGGQL